MLRRLRPLAPMLALGALLGGCASDGIETSTTFDPLHEFPAQATFRWDEHANRLPTAPRLQALGLGSIIVEAANREFAARGYQPVDSGPAGYRLSYELAVHSWIGPDNSRSIGSLSVSLVDAATSHRVWLGFARADFQVGLSDEERRRQLRQTLGRMLANFPPRQR